MLVGLALRDNSAKRLAEEEVVVPVHLLAVVVAMAPLEVTGVLEVVVRAGSQSESFGKERLHQPWTRHHKRRLVLQQVAVPKVLAATSA